MTLSYLCDIDRNGLKNISKVNISETMTLQLYSGTIMHWPHNTLSNMTLTLANKVTQNALTYFSVFRFQYAKPSTWRRPFILSRGWQMSEVFAFWPTLAYFCDCSPLFSLTIFPTPFPFPFYHPVCQEWPPSPARRSGKLPQCVLERNPGARFTKDILRRT